MEITVGKVYEHNKILLHNIKQEKAAKVVPSISSSTDMTQLHSITNPPIREGLGKACFPLKITINRQIPKLSGSPGKIFLAMTDENYILLTTSV